MGLPSSRFFIRYAIGSFRCACSVNTFGAGALSLQDLGNLLHTLLYEVRELSIRLFLP
jgi:hypothetical protein